MAGQSIPVRDSSNKEGALMNVFQKRNTGATDEGVGDWFECGLLPAFKVTWEIDVKLVGQDLKEHCQVISPSP